MINKVIVLILSVVFIIVIAGCEKEGGAEKVGKQVDKTYEKVKKSVGETFDKAREKLDETKE